MKFYKIEDQIIISDKALTVGTELVANTVVQVHHKCITIDIVSL